MREAVVDRLPAVDPHRDGDDAEHDEDGCCDEPSDLQCLAHVPTPFRTVVRFAGVSVVAVRAPSGPVRVITGRVQRSALEKNSLACSSAARWPLNETPSSSITPWWTRLWNGSHVNECLAGVAPNSNSSR